MTPMRTLGDMQAAPLSVTYYGPETIATLTKPYASPYIPVNDEMLRITTVGTFLVPTHFPVSLAPRHDRNLGTIHRTTREILADLEAKNSRGYNIPEAITLALRNQGLVFLAAGQVVHGSFGGQLACVCHDGMYLLPYNRSWPPHLIVPATTAPDPLLGA